MMRRLICLVLLGASVFLLSSCAQPPIRHACPPESLIIDETVLSEGRIDGPRSPLADGGGTSIGIDVFNDEVILDLRVYPYKIPRGAEKEYERELSRPDRYGMLPYDLSALQLRANQYAFQCSQTVNSPRCMYIAIYDNYYIFFILRTMSLQAPVGVIFPAIQDIDNRMMQCLEEYPVQ